MSLVKRVISNIESNKKLREEGGMIAIPWTGLPRMKKIIPGIERGRYFAVTGAAKSAKTQTCDYLFVYQPLKYIYDNPTSNLKPRIFYFSLEMSKEDKILQMISHYIYIEEGIIITPQELSSVFEHYIPSDETIQLIKKYEYLYEFFDEHLLIIDDIRHPTGIFKYMEGYAERHGTYVTKMKNWRNPETNVVAPREVNDYYIPNDPNEVVIVIVDHLSLLMKEKDLSNYETISRFSQNYCLTMRDMWKMVPVIVQQQAAETSKQQFTQQGKSIIEKLKPSTAGLGENKLTQRDVDIMFGVFAPHMYGITEFDGYDIGKLGDHYRELTIIINRRGTGNKGDDLFFHGGVNFFRELPRPDSIEMQKVYEYVAKLKNNT